MSCHVVAKKKTDIHMNIHPIKKCQLIFHKICCIRKELAAQKNLQKHTFTKSNKGINKLTAFHLKAFMVIVHQPNALSFLVGM